MISTMCVTVKCDGKLLKFFLFHPEFQVPSFVNIGLYRNMDYDIINYLNNGFTHRFTHIFTHRLLSG